jgi:hypothetical protein
MTAADAKRALSDVPEAGVITRLLSEVTRTVVPPSPGFAGEGMGVRGAQTLTPVLSPAKPGEGRQEPSPPSPLPPIRERGEESPPRPAAPVPQTKSGVVPAGALTVADFFALVNWKNRTEDLKPLPAVAPEHPPGHEWTVGAVMSAFFGE